MELVPISIDATRSPGTYSARGTYRPDAVVDPASDRVVAPGQVPGVVGVQALDAGPGPPDAAGRARARVAGRQRRVALGRVAAVGRGEGVGVDLALGPVDPPSLSSRPTQVRSGSPTSQ